MVFSSLPARAHDIYTSFAEAKLLADRLEITLTLARATAPALMPADEKIPALTPENFAQLAPRLRAAAPALIHLSTAGQPLAPASATEVKLGGDTDLVFILSYPRPRAGPLKFFARFVGGVVDGHVCTFVLTNAAGDDLGWSPLSFDQPTFQVALPDAAPAKKTPSKK